MIRYRREQNIGIKKMRKLLVIVALVAIIAVMIVQFGPGILFSGEPARSSTAR